MILFPAMVFLGVILFPLPGLFGEDSRLGFIGTGIFFCLFLVAMQNFSKKSSQLFPSCLVAVLFAMPLSFLWHTGFSDASILGGLLPVNDAACYLADAQKLLMGEKLSMVGSRRPIFPSFLAALLGLLDGNLQWTIASMVLLIVVVIIWSTQDVFYRYGQVASATYVVVLFLFFRRYIGTTLTENLGILFGSLAIIFLLRGFQLKVPQWFWGCFFLSLALNTRAGAFFILPTLLVWLYFQSRREPKQKQLVLLGGSIAGIMLAFLCNFTLVCVVGDSMNAAFSNFSYTLYGLAVGGSWTTVVSHPEVIGLSGVDLTNKIYTLAIKAIADNPQILIWSALKAWSMFLWGFAFSFAIPLGVRSLGEISLSTLGTMAILEFISLYGLYRLWKNRENPNSGILLAGLLGIFLSVPLLPPWDADRMRIYAATMPFFALLPSYGMQQLTNMLKINKFVFCKKEKSAVLISMGTVGVFSSVILLLCFVFPLWFNQVSPIRETLGKEMCLPGARSLQLTSPLLKGARLNLVDDAKKFSMMPDIRISDFQNNRIIFNSYYPKDKVELDDLETDMSLGFLFSGDYYVIKSEKIGSEDMRCYSPLLKNQEDFLYRFR